MTERIGEYANAGYVKHVPPGAGSPLENGETLDAGTLILLDSNISWMCRESVRNLFCQPGPGTVSVFADNSKVYDGVVDLVPPDVSGTIVETMEIPWERNTAVRFGPFPMVCDEQSSTNEWLPRKVRLDVRATFTVADLKLYFALTTSPDEVSLYGGQYVAFDTKAATSGVVTSITLVPSYRIPMSTASRWSCRQAGDGCTPLVAVIPAYLWVGYRPVDPGAGTCSIDSINAWETR